MEILKNFAVFEGLDGSGTTTQLGILEDFFLDNNKVVPQRGLSVRQLPLENNQEPRLPPLPPFYKTFEPTNGSIGKMIRQALRKEISLEPGTIALLFAADRNEHLYGPDGIARRCARGELVVSDRYVPSSLVYQGITCGRELPEKLNRDFPGPELLVFFDIDPETAQKRMAGRGIKEIYEYLEFQTEARKRYKSLLPFFTEQGVRVEIIDAALPPEEAAREVWSAVREMPIFKG